MHEPLITVLTVNYNTSDYIELMLYALKRLTRNPYKVIICDNGSRSSDIEYLKSIASQYDNVEIISRQQSRSGSIAHSEALDILIGMSESKYAVIMDSDCTFLINEWDDILINRISDEVKIIGTQLHTDNSPKPDDFPMPFAVLFELSVYKALNISCLPGNIINDQDSCWEWKDKYLTSGYRGELLKAKSTRTYKEGPLRSVVCAEYYLDEPKNIIASHFGRGSSGGEVKYLKWLKLPVISKYIKRFYGSIEKTRWIAECRKIIDKQ